MLWIQIRSDRHNFGGAGFVSVSHKCKAKLPNYTFFQKFKCTVQNIENYDTYEEKEKNILNWHCCEEKFIHISNTCKTWYRIHFRIRIRIGIKLQSIIRIRIFIKIMLIQNTEFFLFK
jgi:hypothetical protein